MILKQVLLLTSLSLFALEIVFLALIKKKLQCANTQDPVIDQLEQFFSMVRPSHYAIYVAIYVCLLFLAKLWAYLFMFIITIQGVSVLVDIYLLYRIIKSQSSS